MWKMFFYFLDKNSFDVGGIPPKLKDKRTKFIKGKFQDTLVSIKKENLKVITVNLDADLYMSTLYVLTRLNDQIKPGTILIFDEFSSPLHELRALEDYIESYLENIK